MHTSLLFAVLRHHNAVFIAAIVLGVVALLLALAGLIVAIATRKSLNYSRQHDVPMK
jgi:hypothetical protein